MRSQSFQRRYGRNLVVRLRNSALPVKWVQVGVHHVLNLGVNRLGNSSFDSLQEELCVVHRVLVGFLSVRVLA